MIRTTVRYKGIQYDLAVLLCGVSFSVSLLVSPVVSSYIVSSRSSRCIVSWGGAVLISSDLSFCYIVIALASSRLVRLVLRCVGRDDFSRLAVSSRFYSVPSFSCVIACSRLALLSRWAGHSCVFCPMSSGILCRLVFSLASLISVRLRLVPVRRRGRWRLVAWSMWGN